jgi:hypothetical protein
MQHGSHRPAHDQDFLFHSLQEIISQFPLQIGIFKKKNITASSRKSTSQKYKKCREELGERNSPECQIFYLLPLCHLVYKEEIFSMPKNFFNFEFLTRNLQHWGNESQETGMIEGG